MNKLLTAELHRMFRHRYYWICTILFGCIPYLAIYLQRQADIRHNNPKPEPPDGVLFAGTFYLSILIAVIVCLHIGAEYSDKTIRNKIALGHSRTAIYVVNWIVCNIGVFVMYLVYVLVSLISGYFLTDGYLTKPSAMCGDLAISFVITMVYTSVMLMIVMVVQSKSAGAVISLVLAVVVMFAGASVMQKLYEPEYLTTDVIMNYNGDVNDTHQPNPAYIDGTEREVVKVIADILPSSQSMQLAEGAFAPEKLKYMPIYSGIIILLSTTVGIYIFNKEDLK
ncbi:MAG: ABC transporter permease subunit [Oscillospiraceae bacterium]